MSDHERDPEIMFAALLVTKQGMRDGGDGEIPFEQLVNNIYNYLKKHDIVTPAEIEKIKRIFELSDYYVYREQMEQMQ
jgi:hypothetical protein